MEGREGGPGCLQTKWAVWKMTAARSRPHLGQAQSKQIRQHGMSVASFWWSMIRTMDFGSCHCALIWSWRNCPRLNGLTMADDDYSTTSKAGNSWDICWMMDLDTLSKWINGRWSLLWINKLIMKIMWGFKPWIIWHFLDMEWSFCGFVMADCD